MDKRAISALEDLRDGVENFNRMPSLALRGGLYRGMDKESIFTTTVDGWIIGYRLKDLGLKMLREIFVKIPGERLDSIPDEQKNPVISAVFNVFLDFGQGEATIDPIAMDTVKITQTFVPMYLVEKNPNIVVPGALH